MRSTFLPFQYRRLLVRVAAMRRSRAVSAASQPARNDTVALGEEGLSTSLPLRAQLANRLTDAMLAIDEALGICEIERNENRDASWIEPQIRSTYEQVDALMRTVCD
jgi:hypothetical protein